MSDVNNKPADPVPGSPEYDAAMAAKFDSASNPDVPNDPPADPPTEPDLILGKFKSQEDLIKAYQELESKKGKPADPPADTNDSPEEGDDAAKKAVANAGLDFAALSAEYADNNGLKPETYEALEKSGIPRSIVDQYIQGQEALVERLQLTAYTVTGGEENYSAITSWASANLSDGEIEAFNKAVNATDPNIVKMAVMGLKGRYEESNGSEPNLIGGEQGGVTGPTFESWAQVTEAMRDPRYSRDPAYRRDVEQKLSRSNPM